jgi:copper chaperone
MIAFQVIDMTCGHCGSMIIKAIKGVDCGAGVAIDVGSKRVDIRSSAAMLEAGYTQTKKQRQLQQAALEKTRAAVVAVGETACRLPRSASSIAPREPMKEH